jgi:pimeloyl-ACP methyl ester carboxylesterase
MRKRWMSWAALAVLVLVGLVSWRPASFHARAAALLLRFASDSPGPFGALGRYDIDEEPANFGSGGGVVPARIYIPRGRTNPPRLVLLHGVHHLGIQEPRLIRFARTLASAGVLVFTPQLQELADYQVRPSSIQTVGDAVHAMAGTPGAPRVGVMGLSFAGAIGLLAAADPHYASQVGYVVSVGTHDDLARVSRFFATNEIPLTDGGSAKLQAHPYGALVLIYSHASDFFDSADVTVARDALRLWLWEDRTAARQKLEGLSPAARQRLDALFSDHLDALRPELLACIERHGSEMAAVSPKGRLASLTVPVLLVHGAGDTVIPPSETRWLAREVPPAELEQELISPVLQHVELEGRSSWKDQLALVHFMASVLREADASRR